MKLDTKFDFFERVDRGIKRGVAQALGGRTRPYWDLAISAAYT